ncbi:hypothetical protein ACMHYB_23420 [Sorangium sp. So ce1128]
MATEVFRQTFTAERRWMTTNPLEARRRCVDGLHHVTAKHAVLSDQIPSSDRDDHLVITGTAMQVLQSPLGGLLLYIADEDEVRIRCQHAHAEAQRVASLQDPCGPIDGSREKMRIPAQDFIVAKSTLHGVDPVQAERLREISSPPPREPRKRVLAHERRNPRTILLSQHEQLDAGPPGDGRSQIRCLPYTVISLVQTDPCMSSTPEAAAVHTLTHGSVEGGRISQRRAIEDGHASPTRQLVELVVELTRG